MRKDTQHRPYVPGIYLFTLPSFPPSPLPLTALRTCRQLTSDHKRHMSLVSLYLYYAKKRAVSDAQTILCAVQHYPDPAASLDFQVIKIESH